MNEISLPYNGRMFRAKNKKFAELVLFVPFFEGSQRKLLRHMKFVTDLGYDAVLFDLAETPAILNFSKGHFKPLRDWRNLPHQMNLPISSQMKFGMKHLYADQIENLLNVLPGPKIVYSFSNPTSAAIESLARRSCVDVSGMVCDSGPSGKFLESVMNLYKEDWGVNSWLIRASLTPLLGMLWSPHLHKDIPKDLALFPKGFRILSIRGWKDTIIPPDHIDAVFEGHANLDWRKLNLPEATHLTGLRDFADEYKPAVEKFLREISTPPARSRDSTHRKPNQSIDKQ